MDSIIIGGSILTWYIFFCIIDCELSQMTCTAFEGWNFSFYFNLFFDRHTSSNPILGPFIVIFRYVFFNFSFFDGDLKLNLELECAFWFFTDGLGCSDSFYSTTNFDVLDFWGNRFRCIGVLFSVGLRAHTNKTFHTNQGFRSKIVGLISYCGLYGTFFRQLIFTVVVHTVRPAGGASWINAGLFFTQTHSSNEVIFTLIMGFSHFWVSFFDLGFVYSLCEVLCSFSH